MDRDERRGERAVFALLVWFVFVQPWRHALTIVPGVSIGPLLGAVLIGSWLVVASAAWSVRRPHSFHGALGLFTALSIASVTWTVDVGLTLVRIATLCYVIALVVVAWDLLDSRARLAIVAQALVLGAFIIGIAGIVDLLQQGALYSRRDLAGVNANELARWVVLAVPFAGGLLGQTRRFGHGIFGYVNVAYLALVPFMVLATGSRQGVVGFLVLIVIGLVILAQRGRSVALDTGHGIAALVVVTVVVVTVRAVSSITIFISRLPVAFTELGTAGGRTAIWLVGIDAFRERPLLGVGAGAYGAITPPGMSADPHSAIVGVAVELGVIGLLTGGLVVVIPLVAAITKPGPTYTSIAILGVLAVFAPVAMLYNNPFNWLVLVFVLAAHAHPDQIRTGVDPTRRAGPDVEYLESTSE